MEAKISNGENGMTNEKLGVLLVDVPEPRIWKYNYIILGARFAIGGSDSVSDVSISAYKCTQQEAKKYPQFRWVSMEEL